LREKGEEGEKWYVGGFSDAGVERLVDPGLQIKVVLCKISKFLNFERRADVS
jgi:hypothetical protein